MQKGTVDSGQEIIGSNLILNIDAAQKRSFPAGLPQVATSGLVLNLDAGNAASYPGTGTTWNDLSGNSNTGTLVNGPTFNSANGGSIVFDGVNDGVSSSSNLNLQYFTAVAWVKTTNSGGYNFIVASSSFNSPIIAGWGVTISTGNTIIFDHCNVATVSSYVAANIYDGNWHQVGIYRTTGNVAGIIYDGNIVTSVSYTNTFTNGNYSVGYRPGGTIYNPFFGGNIAIVQVYNRALSATEVFDNFNATKSRFGYTSISTSGLQLSLDAGDANSYIGSGTFWTDLTANGNNGTLINGPSFNSGNGGSIYTDGADDYVTTGYTGSATDNYTFSTWFKNDNYSETKYVLSRGRDGAGGGWSLFLAVDTAGKAIAGVVPTSPSVVGIGATGTTTLALNTWYYLTGVWTASDSIKIYVNGVLEGTVSTSGRTNLRSSTDGFVLGSVSTSIFTSGYTAIVQIYNRALSASEILDNYNSQKNRFITNATWFDISGNNNNGVLTNGPLFTFGNGGFISFDGTDDYVVTSSSGGSATDSYTFSIWFKNDNYSEDKFILLRGRDGSGNGWSLWLRVYTNGKAEAGAVPTSPSTVGLYATGTSTLALNTWYYITGVWVPNGTLKVYVNGVLETSISTSGYTNLRTSTVGWVLGSLNTGTFTSGYTGNVQVYNRELSATQVLNNFNALRSRFGYGSIVTNGMVLYVDASNSASYSGSGTTWTDLSGSSNNGTLTNGPTFDSANGGSIVFDGSNDYVDFGNASSLNITGTITVSAWVKKAHGTTFQAIVDKGRDNYGGWLLGTNETSTPAPFFKVRIAGVNRTIIANSNHSNNIWTNIVGVYNGSTLSIYQNGVLSNSASYSGSIGTNSISVRAGAANDGGYLNGSIANVQIYNTGLSASEVLQNYYAQRPRFESSVIQDGLQLYLSSIDPVSNTGSGTAWNDISGNNRNFNWVTTPTRGTDTGVPYFRALSNRCVGPASNSFGITNQFTIFIIFKQLSLTANHGFKFYTTGNNRGIAPHLAWNDGNIYFDTSLGRVTVASGGTTAWNVFVFTSDGTTNTVYKNSTSLGSGATGGNLNLISTAVDLGSSDEYGGNSSFWDARLAAFLVYNRGLSSTEIASNVAVLRQAFSI